MKIPYIRDAFTVFCITFLCSHCFADFKDASAIFSRKNFREYRFDREKEPSKEQLSAIWYILSRTGEINIHQMRGERENRVFIRKSDKNNGYMEAVYDGEGKLVTNSYNKGSFNFYYYREEPMNHFLFDSLPWLEWGNAKDDPTTFDERLYYYIQDLDLGIQAYIFESKRETRPKIAFESLDGQQRLAYQFFSYLLFNEKYSIKLEANNLNRLKKDSKFYYQYFSQLRILLGVEN